MAHDPTDRWRVAEGSRLSLSRIDPHGDDGAPGDKEATRAESAELRERLAGRTSVLLGHSGVGKSTLVNALVPDATRAVGVVNAVTGRGRHTSTSALLLGIVASVADTRLLKESNLDAGVPRAIGDVLLGHGIATPLVLLTAFQLASQAVGGDAPGVAGILGGFARDWLAGAAAGLAIGFAVAFLRGRIDTAAVEIAVSIAHAFAVVLIDRVASWAARCSAPTWSTPGRPWRNARNAAAERVTSP